jgi:hypothetical protein
MARFADGVQSLLLESSEYQQHLNSLRDRLRDDLFLADPARFPRYGCHPIAAVEVLSAIFGFTSLEALGQLICATC